MHMVLQCSLMPGSWLASWDQCRLTGSGSALWRCAIQMAAFTLLTVWITCRELLRDNGTAESWTYILLVDSPTFQFIAKSSCMCTYNWLCCCLTAKSCEWTSTCRWKPKSARSRKKHIKPLRKTENSLFRCVPVLLAAEVECSSVFLLIVYICQFSTGQSRNWGGQDKIACHLKQKKKERKNNKIETFTYTIIIYTMCANKWDSRNF